jgi:hypothetical protein
VREEMTFLNRIKLALGYIFNPEKFDIETQFSIDEGHVKPLEDIVNRLKEISR